jgi:hypothetical protein
MPKFLNYLSFFAAILFVANLSFTSSVAAIQIQVVNQKVVSGTVARIRPGLIKIKESDGNVGVYKIQNKDERAISIGGTPVRVAAQIAVTGELPAELAERGMLVQFMGRTNVYGKSDGEISSIEVLSGDTKPELKVDFLERPEGRDAGKVEVVGRVVSIAGNRLQLQVPKSKWAKKERISFTVSDDCILKIADDHLNRVQVNDTVVQANILEFSNGEAAVNRIDIQMVPEREQITTSSHERLQQEFSLYSDEPGEPREMRSKHFVLYTDISDRSANILLSKLETMYALVSGYFSARPNSVIECFVVNDLGKWPSGQLDPRGIAKIAEPAGVTLSTSGPGGVKAVVYSCDKHSVVQHEAIHAFCSLTFGKTGPVWYSEGMAEMGQYWIPGELAVNIDPVVIDYLVNSPPKSLAGIVAAGQITGDSWQAYAWRWALCYMLASNPNYDRRFKKLGMNLMSGGNDSFESAFGKVKDQISFEYDFFVKHLGNGYRSDLCAWDWNVKCSNLSSSGRISHKTKALRGWQATKLLVRPGVSYDYVAQGKWRVDVGDELTANGRPDGTGRLVGMVFSKDFRQGPPFELGEKGQYTSQVEGQLYVRCRDDWTELSDNDGELALHIRRTPKTK